MSEKRFIIVKSIENYYALVDKKREDKEQILIFSLHKEQLGVVCDLLNELNNDFEDCCQLLDSKDDFIHKFKRDIEELGISIKLFEDDIATKDKKIEEQQDTIDKLEEEKEQLKKYCTILKNQIKKMGEIGGFNKYMIKTILESNYDD